MVYYGNRFFFCFKSKTEVKIIAILGLIFSSLSILANIIGVIKYQETWLTFIGGLIAAQIGALTFPLERPWSGLLIILFYALVTLCQLGYLAAFAMLFHGVKKEKHRFIVSFLVFHIISLVVS